MSNIKIGKIVEGQITGITKYGVFVSLEDNYVGMVHISEVSNKYVRNLENMFTIGNIINVKVLSIDEDKLQVKLSIKKINPIFRKKGDIVEVGDGFQPLKDKLNGWVNEKMQEYDEK